MTALQILRLDQADIEARTSHQLSPDAWAVLNRLRWVARRCRAAARVDLFEACAVLSIDRDVADTAHAEVLMKSLSQALGKAPVFYRPGEAEVSFDEAWLMRVITALREDDDASLVFLLRSRVHPSACRNLTYLIRSVSERFSG